MNGGREKIWRSRYLFLCILLLIFYETSKKEDSVFAVTYVLCPRFSQQQLNCFECNFLRYNFSTLEKVLSDKKIVVSCLVSSFRGHVKRFQ